MEKDSKIRIYLAGDSTVADCPPNEEPRAGWGQMLKKFLSGDVQVINYAVGGRSSKSFIDEGRLQIIEEEICKGDFLFIQFGHNDQKEDHRKTEPYSSYQDYLKQYLEVARKKGATPVLITSMHRRKFNDAGKIRNSLGDYPLAMLDLANNENVYCINLWEKSKELYETLGPERSKQLFLWFAPGEEKNYPDGIQDDTHFSEKGAEKIAKLILEEAKQKIPELAKYINL